jgi:hypothetical protein
MIDGKIGERDNRRDDDNDERNNIMISEREREIIMTHVTAKKRKLCHKLCDTSDE